jgi:hypothetical protein
MLSEKETPDFPAQHDIKKRKNIRPNISQPGNLNTIKKQERQSVRLEKSYG